VNDEDVALDVWRGVYNALRASILSGTYPPGERLVEQQLADRFGTSRGPVRTALHELERSGLVVSIDRRGTFVRQLSDQDVEEIFSLMELLWPFVVKRAIQRIGPAERAEIEELKTRIPLDADAETLLTFSVEFGRAVFRMADHSRALEIYDTLLTQAQGRSMFVLAAEGAKGWRQRGRDFLATCDALIAGDIAKASATTTEWLRDVGANLDKRLSPAAEKA